MPRPSVLLEHVVPADEPADLQSLGDEAQVLREREVGVDARGRVLFRTGQGQIRDGVRGSLRVCGIEAPRAVAVTGDERVARSAIGGLPELRLAEGARSRSPRPLAYAVAAEEVDLQGCRLRQQEIKIAAGIDPVEAVSGLVAAVVVPLSEEVAFVQIVDGGEIFHETRTTAHVDVRVIGHRVVLEDLLLPVDVRIALGFFQICRMAVFLDDVQGQHLVPRLG